MPRIIPTGGTVSWFPSEGTLGVVGVAPWATLEFCRSFYTLVAAEKDWHYPRVLLDINTKLPSRGRHLQLNEQDPSPFIATTIAELAAAGATVGVVVCNTAHILFDRWAAGSPIPIIHIVDATIEQACRAEARKVLALVSASLAVSGMYDRKAAEAGLICQSLPGELQESVNSFIEQVKLRGALSSDSDKAIAALLAFCVEHNVDTVFLGCTELSVLRFVIQSAGLCVIDSNEALARAAYAAVRK